MDTLERITQDPGIMGGKPCIRGMRVTVGMIVGQIAGGRSIDDLLADFPYLEREDTDQALRYTALRSEGREVQLTGAYHAALQLTSIRRTRRSTAQRSYGWRTSAYR